MKPKYEKPPYQPKWILQAQVWMLHRRLLPAFNRQSMVITTTGRRTGQKRSVPIDFVRDGNSFLALNMGSSSNWYQNALAHPEVILEIDGKPVKVCAEPVSVTKPEQLQSVLAIYARERPGMIENLFDIAPGTPADELMDIGKYASFMRFRPVTEAGK